MNIYPYKRVIKNYHDFCCYLTIYRGELLPPFYLGSSSVKRINGGYHGSVKSKKWKYIYEKELVENPHLFNTVILRTTINRKMSSAVELYLQKRNDVVTSTFFFNESLAQKDGMFGRDVSGENHPLYNIGHSSSAKKKIKDNHYDCSGKNNSSARRIEVYDKLDNLIITTEGNFQDGCEKIKIPWRPLKRSYQNNSKRIYECQPHNIPKGNEKFIGWYAVNVGRTYITKTKGFR